jgi:hypothetical protein
MVCDTDIRQSFGIYFQAAVQDALIKELKVINYFKLSSKVRIFVFEDVIAMRANGNYLFDPIGFENLNVLKGLHLVKHLIPGAARRIACTGFLFPKYSIVNIQEAQDFRKGPGDFLVTVVKGPRTTNPE